MGDLISREALLKLLEDAKNRVFCIERYTRVVMRAIVDEQPTAFDKEKVIEELSKMVENSVSLKNQCEFASGEYFSYMGEEVAYKTAIAIVEKGGIA